MLRSISCILTITAVLSLEGQSQPLAFDLGQQYETKNIDIFNRDVEAFKDGNRSAIRLSEDFGEGVAWIKGVELAEGTIEFDVRGKDVKQHSFVGVAFHGKNNYTFDAIYLRPFQFREKDETLRSHGIQYVSLPDNTWRILRAKFPGKYEHAVDPAPDPNGWVHLKIVFKGSTISTYVNGAAEPSLVVERLNAAAGGAVGLYVADTSGGEFANLTISRGQ